MKNVLFIFLIISSIVLINACCNQSDKNKDIVKNSVGSSFAQTEHLVIAVNWYQKSAEMRACYLQAYNYAKLVLDKKLEKMQKNKKYAVIVDIDETVLDNSPFEGNVIKTKTPFNLETWKKWTGLAKAKALPGALEFLDYAKSKGVETFYVSNRDIDELNATIKNLKDLNFPCVDSLHLILRENGVSDKTERRKRVSQNFEILLLIGDNLRDFDEIYKNRENYGFDLVDQTKDKFGDIYIILPNPMYGEWEKGILQGFDNPDSVIIQKRKDAVISY